jgi:lysozyme
MQMSPKGLALLEQYEALRLTAYKDEKGIWTIGFGHTPAFEDETCTRKDAEDWLDQDVKWAEDTIAQHVKVTLNQNEFDSLCSLIFNIGCYHFNTSTVLRELNAGNRQAAADAFLMWDKEAHDGALVLSPGLLARRQKERTMFLSAVEV